MTFQMSTLHKDTDTHTHYVQCLCGLAWTSLHSTIVYVLVFGVHRPRVAVLWCGILQQLKPRTHLGAINMNIPAKTWSTSPTSNFWLSRPALSGDVHGTILHK